MKAPRGARVHASSDSGADRPIEPDVEGKARLGVLVRHTVSGVAMVLRMQVLRPGADAERIVDAVSAALGHGLPGPAGRA